MKYKHFAKKSDSGNGDYADDSGHGGKGAGELLGVQLGHDLEFFARHTALALFFPPFVFIGKMGVKRGEEHSKREGQNAKNQHFYHFVCYFR